MTTRNQPRRPVQAGDNGTGRPLQIPPMPRSKEERAAGTPQDIPAALMNKPTEPTPGLSGKLTFYFGGTGEERTPFEFRTPRTGQTGPWRRAVAGPAEEILRSVLNAMDTDLEKKEGLAALLDLAVSKLIDVPDVLRELVLDFSPDLRSRADEIENLAFDEEIAEAFILACKVAFPLASIQSLLRVGAAMKETSSK